MKQTGKKALTLKTLNKSNIWDIQENDIFRLWEAAEKDSDLKDNTRHYLDIIRSAFNIEEVKLDKPEIVKKYEDRGYKVGLLKTEETGKKKWAICKKPIMRITDLTYENIKHISAVKLISVLERNFGGGWESIPQSIQDIIESGFDISTTTLPSNILKKKGGMYDKKIADDWEVLEVPKGSWTEAIFAKEKPKTEKIHTRFDPEEEDEIKRRLEDGAGDDEDLPEVKDVYNESEDDDEMDDDQLTEESYRTTFDMNPEDFDGLSVDVADEESDY